MKFSMPRELKLQKNFLMCLEMYISMSTKYLHSQTYTIKEIE